MEDNRCSKTLKTRNGHRCTVMDEQDSRQEINKYRKFKKVDGATYRKVNQFLRKRTYITAREWAIARLCTDFRTSGGAEMTFIGSHLPELVPFMEDTYTPQAVNQARNAFKKKVRKSSATFFYGAMCGFFTTDELDDLLFEASEVARFLLEVEGTTLDIDEEIDIEDRITKVMRGVGEAAKTLLKNREETPSGGEPEMTSPISITGEVVQSPDLPPVHNPKPDSRSVPVTGQEKPGSASVTDPDQEVLEPAPLAPAGGYPRPAAPAVQRTQAPGESPPASDSRQSAQGAAPAAPPDVVRDAVQAHVLPPADKIGQVLTKEENLTVPEDRTLAGKSSKEPEGSPEPADGIDPEEKR